VASSRAAEVEELAVGPGVESRTAREVLEARHVEVDGPEQCDEVGVAGRDGAPIAWLESVGVLAVGELFHRCEPAGHGQGSAQKASTVTAMLAASLVPKTSSST
jgi:hypothetical protein